MSIRDISDLTDVGIATEAVYEATSANLRRDCYKNNYNWQAKVVSPPQPANSRDLFSLMDANNNLTDGVLRTTPKFTFRAHIKNQGIPQKCRSPHAFLLDPCDLNAAENPTKVRQLIENCILITSPEGYAGAIPQVGDTVNIILRPADEHGTYDLQFGRLESMADSSIRNVRNFLSRRECQSLQDFFEGNPVTAHMVSRTPEPPRPMGTPPTPPGTSESDLPGPANQSPVITQARAGVAGQENHGMPCTSLAAVWVLNQLGLIPPRESWTYTIRGDRPANSTAATWSGQDLTLWKQISLDYRAYTTATDRFGSIANLEAVKTRLGGTVASWSTPDEVTLTSGRWHLIQHWSSRNSVCTAARRAKGIEDGYWTEETACKYEGMPGYSGPSQLTAGHIYLVFWDGSANIRYIDASYNRPYKDELQSKAEFISGRSSYVGGTLTLPIGPGDGDPMQGLASYATTPTIESVTV